MHVACHVNPTISLSTFSIECFFNRELNRGCLVYMFSLRFSGSKVLINLRRQFRVRKIYCIQGFAGFTVFSVCVYDYYLSVKLYVTYVAGCSFIKTCSLAGY